MHVPSLFYDWIKNSLYKHKPVNLSLTKLKIMENIFRREGGFVKEIFAHV